MASAHRHTIGQHTPPPLLLLLLLLVTVRCSSAQPPPSNNYNPNFANASFNPSMAIVIVVLISAFFFLGFFSIYIRQCAGDRRDPSRSARNTAAATRSRRNRGLDPSVLATFPTLVYSDVRAHKIGKHSLECAVCLSEFEDDETLRLLPRCNHVFHTDCIDAWLAAHATCPVCRSNLSEIPADDPPAEIIDTEPVQEPEPPAAPVEEGHVAISIDPEDQERIDNLERFVNMKRARSRARPARFPRSHSTGHSLVLPGENLDRFTLRLPENIRKEIVERAEMTQRTKSLVAFPSEESSRRGYRSTRSIRLGRSDRWGSFLLRTLSTKMTNWGRRVDDDGSTSRRGGGLFRRGESMKGEGSSARGVRFNSVVDCYGGAKGENLEGRSDEPQSSSPAAMMNRV